jgi:hypothetical protein
MLHFWKKIMISESAIYKQGAKLRPGHALTASSANPEVAMRIKRVIDQAHPVQPLFS